MTTAISSPGCEPNWVIRWNLPATLTRFEVPNKRVAVEPFPVNDRKAEVKGGVLSPMNQTALTPLRVQFPTPTLSEGWIVYVRTRLATSSTYGKEVFEAGDKKFILIPEEEIVLVDRLWGTEYRPERNQP